MELTCFSSRGIVPASQAVCGCVLCEVNVYWIWNFFNSWICVLKGTATTIPWANEKKTFWRQRYHNSPFMLALYVVNFSVVQDLPCWCYVANLLLSPLPLCACTLGGGGEMGSYKFMQNRTFLIFISFHLLNFIKKIFFMFRFFFAGRKRKIQPVA